MAVKAKTKTKRKPVAKKKRASVNGLVAYQRKLKAAPKVKKADAKVKKLEKELKAAKKEKAAAKKEAAKKLK